MKPAELIGKTIINATSMKYDKEPGNVIKILFSDGSECFFEGSHGQYHKSCEDEYPDYVNIHKSIDEELKEDIIS